MAAASASTMDPKKHGPPTVINAGLMRTGSMSMTRAYEILGLRAHHGLDMAHLPGDTYLAMWAQFEKAADAAYPDAPYANRKQRPLTRADWDVIFGNYDVTTDVGAYFAEELATVYPEAKVVIVQRDFDSWWKSYQERVLNPQFSIMLHWVVVPILAWISGMRGGHAMYKIARGFFHAETLDQARANARDVYFGYYDHIRTVVPAERRLEYKLGDGWKPLCEFLGKDVPNVPFPRVNDNEETIQRQKQEWKVVQKIAGPRVKPWAIGLASLAVVAVGLRLVG